MIEFINKNKIKFIIIIIVILLLVYFAVDIVFSNKSNISNLKILTLEVNTDVLTMASVDYLYGYRTQLKIKIGGVALLYYHLNQDNLNGNIVYMSENESIATISKEGMVTGLKVGSTKLYAQDLNDNNLISNYIEAIVE
jgi:hypothetical protein